MFEGLEFLYKTRCDNSKEDSVLKSSIPDDASSRFDRIPTFDKRTDKGP